MVDNFKSGGKDSIFIRNLIIEDLKLEKLTKSNEIIN
jgi:hypothetical protein